MKHTRQTKVALGKVRMRLVNLAGPANMSTCLFDMFDMLSGLQSHGDLHGEQMLSACQVGRTSQAWWFLKKKSGKHSIVSHASKLK